LTTPTFFITGTDTSCGKTSATVALGHLLGQAGHRVACFKPVASGCEPIAGQWRNKDALSLMEAGYPTLDYAVVNPVALREAIAPHIAAERQGISIEVESLAAPIRSHQADIRLVEGAGGWMVPLDGSTMTSDLVRALQAQVILVVGLRLGAINHALLSARAIEADGFERFGWIANRLDPEQPFQNDNIETLMRFLGPPMAILRHGGQWQEGADLDALPGRLMRL